MALPQAVSNSNKRTFYVLSFTSILGAATYIPPEGQTCAVTDINGAAQFHTVNAAVRRVNSTQWAHVALRLVRVEETTTQGGAETRRVLAETESAPTFGTQDVVKYALQTVQGRSGSGQKFLGNGTQDCLSPLNSATLWSTQADALTALQRRVMGSPILLSTEMAVVRVLVSPAKPVVTLTETVLS